MQGNCRNDNFGFRRYGALYKYITDNFVGVDTATLKIAYIKNIYEDVTGIESQCKIDKTFLILDSFIGTDSVTKDELHILVGEYTIGNCNHPEIALSNIYDVVIKLYRGAE
jgi:hypothetical protein